jgi:glucose/arabinose dehydrogenase
MRIATGALCLSAIGAMTLLPSAGAGRQADAAGQQLRLVRVGTFAQPTFLASPPGDRTRRFVVERDGRIRIMRGARKLRRPFLNIASRVQTGGESGLLSIAFDPGYARNRLYYVYYVDRAGALRVDRYRASASSPNRTQGGSRRTVIREPHPRGNHKGGQLQFGHDGMLYIGFGDGGGGGDPDRNGQRLSARLGKLLRIDPRPGGGYRVPRDNPFARRAGTAPEVFAYGLRNPYRFSFDRRTGDLALSDVGQDNVEEVDFVPVARGRRRPRGGVNFGWSAFEGRSRYPGGEADAPGHLPPVIERRHSQGSCSITGGYVIRDRAMGRFRGRYVYGDFCDARLRVAKLRRGRAQGDRAAGPRVSSLVSFGEDGRGRVHAMSLEGAVYRLVLR